MNTKGIIIGIIVLAVIGFFVFKGINKPETNPYMDGTSAPVESINPNSGDTDTVGQTPDTTKEKTYTMSDVSAHNNKSDCWTAINGGVYNLTTWIGQHPGGEQAILQLCGKDGSAAFNGQHGGMAQQAQILATFRIGLLTQ
jgi:cytochrome b involved in lipid metabolism